MKSTLFSCFDPRKTLKTIIIVPATKQLCSILLVNHKIEIVLGLLHREKFNWDEYFVTVLYSRHSEELKSKKNISCMRRKH